MTMISKALGVERGILLFTLFIIFITIPGCEKKELKNQINYLQGEVDGLQGEVNGLEKEKEGLQGKLKDIARLEKELKAMRAKTS